MADYRGGYSIEIEIARQREQAFREELRVERREKRQAEVRQTAWGVFARRGVAATSLDRLAWESGLSAGGLRRCYPDKNTLLAAMLIAAADTRI